MAFLRKETLDVVHQPRLLLTLVLGPFLILAGFGLGYRQQPKPFRTLFVAPEGSPLLARTDRYVEGLGPLVRYEGTSNDEAEARRRLLDGRLDVVVLFPPDPLADVTAGRRSVVTVLHNRLDPIEITTMGFASKLAVDEINSQILAELVTRGQEEARPLRDLLAASRTADSQRRAALARGDRAGADQAARELRDNLRAARATAGAADLLVRGVLEADTSGAAAAGGDSTELLDTLDELLTVTAGTSSSPSTASSSGEVGPLLDRADRQLATFTAVEASVLVRPLTSRLRAAGSGTRTVTDFYAPAAIVLLLQQFGVAFGALSFVRERQLGVLELLRASPLGAPATVIGKYLAYLFLGGVVAAALTALVVRVLDVPVLGSWGAVAVTLGLTLFASIGLGFLLSLLSSSDTQVVQYTLIVLLASLFFSGFFLTLAQLSYPARAVSWLLPATFGMELLRNTMLRGRSIDPAWAAGFLAYGIVAAALVLWGARRRLRVR